MRKGRVSRRDLIEIDIRWQRHIIMIWREGQSSVDGRHVMGTTVLNIDPNGLCGSEL